jgi:hypothetical protein
MKRGITDDVPRADCKSKGPPSAAQRHLGRMRLQAKSQRRMTLYLDIDGVFLRGTGPSVWNGSWEVAPHTAEFLEWALSHHNPVWLTARDRPGTGEGVSEAFANALGGSPSLSQLAARIPFRQWEGAKTTAMDFREDFLWLDDCPRPADLLRLEREGCVDRWIEVNTDTQPYALLYAFDRINGLERDGSSPTPAMPCFR